MRALTGHSRLFPIALVAILFGPACSAIETLTPPPGEEARWTVDPTVRLAEDATTIPLLVNEVGCASGRSADGRIRHDVLYEADTVAIVVYVTPLQGDQACPSNPNTPWTVELREPLGGRELVNGARSDIARQPVEIVGDGPGPDLGAPGEGSDVGLRLRADGDDVDEQHFFIAEALHARAQDASELEDVTDLSIHPAGVELILGNSGISRSVAHDQLTDPANWELDSPNGYEGFEGPFSALEVLRGRHQLVVTVGDHLHCAAPPRPAPDHLAALTRLGITPDDATSCIEWFSVDLYLDEAGAVRAIVLDFFGP